MKRDAHRSVRGGHEAVVQCNDAEFGKVDAKVEEVVGRKPDLSLARFRQLFQSTTADGFRLHYLQQAFTRVCEVVHLAHLVRQGVADEETLRGNETNEKEDIGEL